MCHEKTSAGINPLKDLLEIRSSHYRMLEIWIKMEHSSKLYLFFCNLCNIKVYKPPPRVDDGVSLSIATNSSFKTA